MHNKEPQSLHHPVPEGGPGAASSPPYRDYICGGCAAISNIILVFPLHKTIFFQQLHGLRWWDAAKQLQFGNIYRGVLPPLLQKTGSSCLMFGVYATMQQRLAASGPTWDPRVRQAVAASCAGLMECVLVPFERVQTLLQDRNHDRHLRNTKHAFSVVWTRHGVRELYRGLTPILYRNCLGNSLYFVCKEGLEEWRPAALTERGRLAQDFVCGALLGSAISMVNYPLNVAKTQMQSRLGGGFVSLPSTLTAVFVERGRSVRHLYRGVFANCLRSMLSWAVITMTYEWTRRVFFD